MKLYLTGFMGSGKSAVGQVLAERLGLGYVDLDLEIERIAGATVVEIFERQGEAGFRHFESQALDALASADGLVVATGGGTIAQPGNRDRMSGGLVIWLNPPFATIVERIGFLGKAERPLFRDEVQALELYKARLPAYGSADLRIDVPAAETLLETVARIELAVRQRRR